MTTARDGEAEEPGGKHGGSAARPDRRKLDEIFGDVLPETTSDERGQNARRTRSSGESDEWYLENRPPHHGS